MLCNSFKSCALPPSLLFHALFLSPIQTHKAASTIFWRDDQKIVGLGREILYNIFPFLNPLILPNTGHTGDLGDTQTPVRGIPGGHHALTCLGIGLQKVVMPQPVRGSSSARGPRKLSASTCPGTQSSGGCHASTCPGILSLGGCHASVYLGICTLTWGRLALRLQQFWVGRTYIIYIPVHSGQNKPLNSTQHW